MKPYAEEPLLQPQPKPRIEIGDFTTFKFPLIRPKVSAVDELAAIVDPEAAERVRRKKQWPRLFPADIARSLPARKEAGERQRPVRGVQVPRRQGE